MFVGKVLEPKVTFSNSKIDFHAIAMGSQGGTEIITLDNKEHIPFNFSFDKSSMSLIEGAAVNGFYGTSKNAKSYPVLEIEPKSGVVPPYGSIPITFKFRPQEETHYNFNLVCEVKRKPQKLMLNVKGEGFAVHALVALETGLGSTNNPSGTSGATSARDIDSNGYMILKPAPANNFCDFGIVQLFDTVTRKISVTNQGKFNFDYFWDFNNLKNSISFTQGKLADNLGKGCQSSHMITYNPMSEESIDGTLFTLTIAGKYVYNIIARGRSVQPALNFSFMHFDFGSCFVSSDEVNSFIYPSFS